MKPLRTILILLAAASPAWAQGENQGNGGVVGGEADELGPCDCRTVESATWCPGCFRFLENPRREAPHDVCQQCHATVQTFDVCVKRFWRCRSCGRIDPARGGRCHDQPMEAVVDRARVIYRCAQSDCPTQGYERVQCHREGCPHQGDWLVRSCEKSGQEPHATRRRHR